MSTSTVRATAPTLRPSLRNKAPGTRTERQLWDEGHRVVVGIDEVGRGAWAGPLTLAAVVIPRERRLTKVRDSKLLTEPEREVMYGRIVGWAEAWGVGHAWPDECDELGMSRAQRLAARRALDALGVAPDRVLLDGNWDFVGGGTVRRSAVTKIVKGDATCLSIAAASIVAKVTRDRIMRAEADARPWWSFEQGVPVPAAQDGAGRGRALGDPPSVLGVHGAPPVDGCRADRAPSPPPGRGPGNALPVSGRSS